MAEPDLAEELFRPWLKALEAATGPLSPFDAHTHVGQHDPDGFRQTTAELRQGLDRIGARAACFAMCEPDGYPAANDRVIRECEASDGQLVPYCRLDPRVDPIAEAERCIASGARGIKLHPRAEGFTLAEPAVTAIAALAHEYRLPLMIHAGRGIPALGEQAVDLARTFPDAKLILAHSAVSDLAWLWRILPETPNVFIDTSWWNPADLMMLFGLVPPGQIVWASDSPYGRPSLSLAFQLRCAIQTGLSREAIAMVGGGQMERLVRGEPGVDLGPAPGFSPLTEPACERVASHLYSAVGRAIAGQDATESLALAELACADPSSADPELMTSLRQLVGHAREIGPAPGETGPTDPAGHPRPPELEFVIAALMLARTPAVPVPPPA